MRSGAEALARTRSAPWRASARNVIVAMLVAGGLAGPWSRAADAASAGKGTAPATLTVFAAASLTDAFTDLAHHFETAHPGTAVRISFAGSQQLVSQLAAGASADVFASADSRWMDEARTGGLIDGEPRLFARNVLVVIVPASNPARVDRVDQLARAGVKLVVCAPTVPAGRYGRLWLGRLESLPGAGPGWSARVLANVVSEEDNVRAVVGKVSLGEADAGLVYRSDVTPSVRRSIRILTTPDSLDVVAEYPLAVVRNAPAGPLARVFVDYVCSADGQRVLASHGFRPVATAP